MWSSVLAAPPTARNINAGVRVHRPVPVWPPRSSPRAPTLGLAFDGDADRVIAVDGTGAVVDGDRLLGLFALDLRRRGRLAGDTVVVTVMTNLGFHLAMAARRRARPPDAGRATATCSRPSTPTAGRSAVSSRATSSSGIWPPPATGCSPGFCCSTCGPGGPAAVGAGRRRHGSSAPGAAQRGGARPERRCRRRSGVGGGPGRRSRPRRRGPGAAAPERHRAAGPGHGRGRPKPGPSRRPSG